MDRVLASGDWVREAVIDFFLWLSAGIIFAYDGAGNWFTLILILAGLLYLERVATQGSWIWKEVFLSIVTFLLSLEFQDTLSEIFSGLATLMSSENAVTGYN